MTNGTKTTLCFASAGVAAALSLYSFAGALMNGSFAVAGPVDPERFHRSAAIFFWFSVVFASLALGSLTWGFVRLRRGPKRSQTAAAQQAVEADDRASS
jgi:hypothetical protein